MTEKVMGQTLCIPFFFWVPQVVVQKGTQDSRDRLQTEREV